CWVRVHLSRVRVQSESLTYPVRDESESKMGRVGLKSESQKAVSESKETLLF
ncbi:hypothetical protein M9458_000743, partial [Cirrhinus mrigala]